VVLADTLARCRTQLQLLHISQQAHVTEGHSHSEDDRRMSACEVLHDPPTAVVVP
jgi:hypothetical protein